ncbi:MAG: XdhC family protein [Proteobacteria bacterium]|nr:XdhC family protein [Pseudomonadota bacterium]
MNIYEVITEHLEQGKGGILATVIKRTGSAPRDVGAKMFIGEDGKTFGTVGGGRLESDTYREAIKIMNKGLTKVFSMIMNAQRVEEKDMLCGGNVDVLLEPVTARHLAVYQQIENCLENRKRGVVVTRFSGNTFAKALIDENLNVTGDVLGSETINQCKGLFHEKQAMLTDGVLADPIQLSFPLYIFGAGHVAQFLSKIAKIADFHITVIDDREEFANSERFPDADTIIVGDFHDAFKCLDFTGNEYVVILTRSHEYDAEVLGECLKETAKYIGMIGSRRKVKIILDHMREKGFSSEVLERIHSPIGISINAETPEEIAISIAAELVSVRNAKDTLPDKIKKAGSVECVTMIRSKTL